MNYWPAANRPGEGPTLFNNYFRTGKRVSDTYTWVGRMDHLLTEKHRISDESYGPTLEAAREVSAKRTLPSRRSPFPTIRAAAVSSA